MANNEIIDKMTRWINVRCVYDKMERQFISNIQRQIVLVKPLNS